jgi:hypothetical protein
MIGVAKTKQKSSFKKNAIRIWWIKKLALPLQSVRLKKAAVFEKKNRR